MENRVSRATASADSSNERSRRYRQRRRRGTRCILIDLDEAKLAALVASGYLAKEARTDAMAIKKAIETVISDIAFELEYGLAASSRSARRAQRR
jgi:hypothetical protein